MKKIQEIINAGLQAPSGDNAQPWCFKWDGETLRLALDTQRSGSPLDFQRVPSLISVGAVMVNMRIAAQQAGLAMRATLFPEGEPLVAAKITFSSMEPIPHPLYEAIFSRCTNRKPYFDRALSSEAKSVLKQTIEACKGVNLHMVDAQRGREQIAHVLAQYDGLFYDDRITHDEILYRWLRWTPAQINHTKDGLPISSLELNIFTRLALKLGESWWMAKLLRLFGGRSIAANRARAIYRASAAFGLITAEGTTPREIVAAGEAAQMFWLAATKLGLSLHPVTGSLFLMFKALKQPEKLSVAQRRLSERIKETFLNVFPEIAHKVPVILFRMGYSNAPSSRALRRRVEEVLTIQDSVTSNR